MRVSLTVASHLLSQKFKQLMSDLHRLFLWNPVSGIFYLSAFHLMGNPLERLHCFQPPPPTLGTAESEHWHGQFAIVFNAAAKPVYQHAEIELNKVLVVTDLVEAQAKLYQQSIRNFLSVA